MYEVSQGKGHESMKIAGPMATIIDRLHCTSPLHHSRLHYPLQALPSGCAIELAAVREDELNNRLFGPVDINTPWLARIDCSYVH